MGLLCFKLFFLTFYFTVSMSMMMRNDALISKMISNFQKDNTLPLQSTPPPIQNPKDVLTLMQNVLCKNFPTIPCQMIIEDETLRTLIERSIQQLKYKKLAMQKTTPPPAYHLTLFPIVNSEDLSNFLQESDTGYYSQGNQEKARSRRHKKRLERMDAKEKEYLKNSNNKKDNQRSSLYQGHKKIRKFYPHKIKHKEKMNNIPKENTFRDYSEEKFSMSVENPEANVGGKRMNPNFRQELENPPVWRIDYMKHGVPSLNMFDYESDRLKEKLVKTGPNVIVNDGPLEQAPRKDVLHPDVYIKRNYVRRNALDIDSVGID